MCQLLFGFFFFFFLFLDVFFFKFFYRFREIFFGIYARDEPASEFLRQWKANIPLFPTDEDEYERLQELARKNELFPEPPLVPYDVPGVDWSKKPKIEDLYRAQVHAMYKVRYWFLGPSDF